MKQMIFIFLLSLSFSNLFAQAGELDSTFDSDGVVLTSFGSLAGNDAASVLVQPDGKIVVGGLSYILISGYSYGDFALARYNSDGSLDNNFGGGGLVTLDLYKP